MITFCVFLGLVGLTLGRSRSRQQLRQKTRDHWILDGSGLIVQGILIPCLQIFGILHLLTWIWPSGLHSLHWHPMIGFLMSFVAVDYLYYWNHRWLHTRALWPIHRVHHTVTEMDVLATSRNTVWSSFFILYVWIHALFLWLLADPTGYLIGVGVSNALDLWRHSPGFIPEWWPRRLMRGLILPIDHAWHHSRDRPDVNFGANFKLWDQIHGTAHTAADPPLHLGISLPLSLTQQLFYPIAPPAAPGDESVRDA